MFVPPINEILNAANAHRQNLFQASQAQSAALGAQQAEQRVLFERGGFPMYYEQLRAMQPSLTWQETMRMDVDEYLKDWDK